MNYYKFLVLFLLLGVSCSEDEAPVVPEVTDESYLTEVVMQHFAILDGDGHLVCRTAYANIDKQSGDTSTVYAVAPTLARARSIYTHLVAESTVSRIVANADSTEMTYSIAGNTRHLEFSATSGSDNQVAVIRLPYPDAYRNIATTLVLVKALTINSGDTSGYDINHWEGNKDDNDARH